MIIHNVKQVNEQETISISVKAGMIEAVLREGNMNPVNQSSLNFGNAIVFPGLINSHDHLDFNCFNPLGERVYANYTEWGKHIHDTYKDEIRKVLGIPQKLRTAWGVYKNLLAGVTTVVNHGDLLPLENPLITVYQEPQSLHSVSFQKRWKWKLNNPLLKFKECVIHTGEGIDTRASREIDELLKWNLLKRKLVGVHAVAMDTGQAKKFKGLVWCPESNRFLFNKDAAVRRLKDHTQVVFGTDSTLTGNWNIWAHLRLARLTGQVSDEELFKMVTSGPAHLWGQPTGQIKARHHADLVIVREKRKNNWEGFYSINPEDILMVMHRGKIRLFDEELLPQLKKNDHDIADFYPITFNESVKFVKGNLPRLLHSISNYYPKADFPCRYFEKIQY